eukprot:1386622-Amorphochlora_amoeboformis.AAC.1
MHQDFRCIYAKIGGGAEGKKKNVGAIVGGTLGGLAGAVILIAAGVWMYKRYKASNPYAPMENDLDHDDHQDELHQPLQDDGPPLSEIGPEISVAEVGFLVYIFPDFAISRERGIRTYS